MRWLAGIPFPGVWFIAVSKHCSDRHLLRRLTQINAAASGNDSLVCAEAVGLNDSAAHGVLLLNPASETRSVQRQKGAIVQGKVALVVALTSILSNPAFAQGAVKLTDAQIAHFIQTARQVDAEGAKLALSKSANRAVRDFAQGLARDGIVVNKRTAGLVHKLKLTPEDNDLSRALTEHAAYRRAELAKLKGAEFDKAYIANEAAYQMTVKGALAVTLIPAAANPELKSLLQSSLSIFEGHQQRAKEAASALK